jgi:hypothetical protein
MWFQFHSLDIHQTNGYFEYIVSERKIREGIPEPIGSIANIFRPAMLILQRVVLELFKARHRKRTGMRE